MTEIIIGLFIFCIVLFIYLHIQFHLKTSNDLEMYEIEQASKDKLEEICDLRQPVLFDFDNKKIIDNTNKDYVLSNYHAFEIKIRNVKDDDSNSELYMPLPLHAAVKLFNGDKKSMYFSENNSDFLQETGVIKNMRYNDEFLRPYMVSNCNYDILMGSTNCITPFRYEINYRNYFILTQGKAQIKMAPPQSTKYLYPVYDYENFEFRTPINPWDPQPKYSADFDKIKCLEFTLTPGKTLFLPSYWWYSIKFDENTSISVFKYRTYMNNLAILPYIGLHALQIQNVKRNVAKTIDIKTLNNNNKNDNNINNYINEIKNDITKDNTNNNTYNDNVINNNETTSIDNLPSSKPEPVGLNSQINTPLGTDL